MFRYFECNKISIYSKFLFCKNNVTKMLAGIAIIAVINATIILKPKPLNANNDIMFIIYLDFSLNYINIKKYESI